MRLDNNITKSDNNIFDYLKHHINKSFIDKYTKASIEHNIIDPISLDIVENPVMTICNHSFDKIKLLEWTQNKRNCPVCRHEFY